MFRGRTARAMLVAGVIGVLSGCGGTSHDSSASPGTSISAVAADHTPSGSPSPASTPIASFEPGPSGALLAPFVDYPYVPPATLPNLDVNAGAALGSGCSPSSATSLPDGEWFGYVNTWGSDSISFDLACAYEDWDDQTRLRYTYATNDSTRLRDVPVGADAQYVFNRADNDNGYTLFPFAYSFATVVDARGSIGLPQKSNAVWLYVNGGVVTTVEAWVNDSDLSVVTAGMPFVPWGPESAPDTDRAYAAEVAQEQDPAAGVAKGLDSVRWSYWEPNTLPTGASNPTGARGSGCTPETPDSLPDGVWYGHVTEWRLDAIEFDLACLWNEDSPNADECSGTCYPVSDDSDRTRTISLDPDAQFLPQQSLIRALPARSVIGVPEQFRPDGWTDWVWIYVNNGKVTQFHGLWQS